MMHAVSEPCERRFIAFAAPRGGIGKSTVVRQLARLLSRVDEKGKGQRRVLCLDFDRERGGLATMFEPTATPGRQGWMSLIQDALQLDDAGWSAALRRLDPDVSDSLVRPVDDLASTGKLFYLPMLGAPVQQHATAAADATASVQADSDDEDEPTESEQLAREFERLRPSWEALRKQGEKSPARERLSQARAVLQQRFDYVLMDLEAGTAAFEDATTLLSPDATVILFRPVVSQMMASASLAFRAYLAASDEDPRIVPVVPLLTHRPALADPRIETIRDIGRRDAFPWLAAESDLMGPAWHELPYDAGAAVDESPVSMDGAWDPLLDPQSPFCVALFTLCDTLRQLNARVDPMGADTVATRLLLDGLVGPAARYVGAALRAEPTYLPRWRAFGPAFVRHCSTDAMVRATLAKLGADFGLDQDAQPIDARCYAQLWHATAELPRHESAARRSLEDLWRWSMTQNLSSRVRADLLLTLVGLARPASAEGSRTLPRAADATRQRLAIVAKELRQQPSTSLAQPEWSATDAPEELASCLLAYARHHDANLSLATEALFDVMRLDVAPELVVRAQWQLAEALTQHGRETAALAAHLASASVASDVKQDAELRLIRFLSILAPVAQALDQVRLLPRAEDSASWRAKVTLRVSRNLEDLVQAIGVLREDSEAYNSGLIQAVCRAILRDADGSLSSRAERLFAVLPTRARWNIVARAVREFAAWTDRLAPFSEDVQDWARQFEPARAGSVFDLRAVLLASAAPDDFKRVVLNAATPATLTQQQALAFLQARVSSEPEVELSAWQKIRFERSGLPAAFHRIHARQADQHQVTRLALASWQSDADAAPQLTPDEEFLQRLREATDSDEGGTLAPRLGLEQLATKWHDALAADRTTEGVSDGPRLSAEFAVP